MLDSNFSTSNFRFVRTSYIADDAKAMAYGRTKERKKKKKEKNELQFRFCDAHVGRGREEKKKERINCVSGYRIDWVEASDKKYLFISVVFSVF